MGINTFEPAVPQKSKDITLGEGVLYKNYGEVDQEIIGATRTGSELNIEWSKKVVAYDGALAETKNLRRSERCIPKLTVRFLKLNYEVLNMGINTTVTDGSDQDGTYKKITFNKNWDSSDILENITFKGFKANGEFCIIKLQNALNIDPITFEFKEKDELVGEMIYTGFYGYSTPTTPPLVIQEEIA